ncbi:MAG: potassium transporter Kup [Deltaproteobacteria bacterium]|nr:potassium transporter Kup [Deltaproteobacteria bacterium]
MAALVLGAIGVVYGDIGTSPLYTLTECLHGPHGVAPTPANVFGLISLIIWSITMVVTVKYLSFLMKADNQGEGGIMALLALVPSEKKPKSPGQIGLIAFLVIAGAALLFGDGIITPAISVLSAAEGLSVATSKLEPYVVPSTIVILAALFAIQSKGTGGIGKAFGPIMVLWFTVLGLLGVWNITKDPRILGALSPHHALAFFQRNGSHGFRVLGGVVLAVTGGEALYADMGHFGRAPIRNAWLGLVFPALGLCYLGQGASALVDPTTVQRPFYSMMPQGPWIYGAVALASAATVIASQALISGAFSLTQQAIRLGYFPRLRILHTSVEAEGQIFVPMLNRGLAVSCIALVLIFRKSSNLAAAYGLAVSGTMAITSIVFYVVTREHWGWSKPKAAAVLVLFLAFDLPFLVANALKFFAGGYLPFLVGVGFVLVMVSWRIGRSYLAEKMKNLSSPLDAFIAEMPSKLIGRVPGVGVVLASQQGGAPPVLNLLVRRFQVLHEHLVLVTIVTDHVPEVGDRHRHHVEKITDDIFRVVLHYGYMQTPNVPEALLPALHDLGLDATPDQLTYFLGRETLLHGPEGHMSGVLEAMFLTLSRNVRSATDYFSLPPNQVVELGIQLDI